MPMLKRVRSKIWEWRALIGSFVAWTAMGIWTERVVNKEASLGTPEASVALAVLELIALTLPALAILLQVALKYSERSFLAINGQSTMLRRISFLAAGISASLLFVATRIVMKFLVVPEGIGWALNLVSFAILAFSAIPLALGAFLLTTDISQLSSMLDANHLYDELESLTDRDEKAQKEILKAASIEDGPFSSLIDEEPNDADTDSPLRTRGSDFYTDD